MFGVPLTLSSSKMGKLVCHNEKCDSLFQCLFFARQLREFLANWCHNQMPKTITTRTRRYSSTTATITWNWNGNDHHLSSLDGTDTHTLHFATLSLFQISVFRIHILIECFPVERKNMWFGWKKTIAQNTEWVYILRRFTIGLLLFKVTIGMGNSQK